MIDYIIRQGDRKEWNDSLDLRRMVGSHHLPLICRWDTEGRKEKKKGKERN